MSDVALSDLLARLEAEGIRLGLERFRRLLAALGSPERAAPAVLVGGTNGKGSTVALLAALFRHAGRRVGLYTSPHLEDPRERIRLDGRAVGEGELHALLLEVVAASERIEGELPTYFEAFTAAAFLAFARSGCEVAVLEVGVGGRLDATNASEPVVSVITSISRDHEALLGEGPAAIAGEKAWIFRRGRPALVAPTSDEAQVVLRGVAGEIGAIWHELTAEVAIEEWDAAAGEVAIEVVVAAANEVAQWGMSAPAAGRSAAGVGAKSPRLRLTTPEGRYLVAPPLYGHHQWINLALAIRAAELFSREMDWPWSPAVVAPAVAGWCWPGRLERLELPVGEVILDAAHNPAGVEVLLDALEGQPFVLLFGALGDKRIAEMLPPLADHAAAVVLTRPESSRAIAPEELAVWVEDAILCDAVPTALAQALAALARGDAPRLLVCGSIFLIGQVRGLLRERYGLPAAPQDTLVG